MENRPDVEPIPCVTSAWQVDVTALRGWIIFVQDYIDQFLVGEFRVEGHFVALKSFWALRGTLRPLDDEPVSSFGNGAACSRASPDIEICENLWVGDFDRGFEIRAFDRDFGYVRFCEHPGRDLQREEGDQNKTSPHRSSQARRPKLEHPQLERSIVEPI